MNERILSALGLPADASEEAVLKRLSEIAPKAETAPLPNTERAAFDAMAREAHHEVKLQSEIATLREQQRVSSVREILRSTDRYTTPAFETYALSKSPDEVRAMLLVLPQKPSALHAPRGKASTAELTPADLRMCRLLGQDANELLAHKAKTVARDQQKQRTYASALAAEMEDF